MHRVWVNGAYAHHSYAEFDDKQTIEFEGKLIDVAWLNPHVRIVVEAAAPGATPVMWDIETTSLNAMRRMGVPFDTLTTGGTVKVAVWPSKKSDTACADSVSGKRVVMADGFGQKLPFSPHDSFRRQPQRVGDT